MCIRDRFKLYNYAEFYTVATKHTDDGGVCGLTAGKGDMLVLSLIHIQMCIRDSAYTERNLLQKAAGSEELLKEVLVMNQKWVPYPAYKDVYKRQVLLLPTARLKVILQVTDPMIVKAPLEVQQDVQGRMVYSELLQ